MFAPLVLLAIMAIVSGWNFAGGISPLHKTFELHFDSLALQVSLGSFVVGVFFAWKLYRNVQSDPLENNKVAQVFRNKFYFDEFYAKVVGYLQDGVAAVVHFIDELLIGGFIVEGLSRTAAGVGRLFTRLQSGNLQGYAGLFGIGVLLVIYLTVFVS
jgi:NADH-quinone oxidoreductase subunit L